MEKEPQMRIIGNASPEQKERVEQNLKESLFNHTHSLTQYDREQLENFEIPKSELELELINFANRETSLLMEDVGITAYDIPSENYHIIASELYEKLDSEGVGIAFPLKKAIMFDVRHFQNNPVYFAAVAVHETLHLKGHFSAEVQQGDDKVYITPYREGVSIRALQKYGYHGEYHSHFDGLHEAIVAEAEKKLLKKILALPQLEKEKDWLESTQANEMRKELVAEENISSDDIIWLDKNERGNWEAIQYAPQRKVLNYICLEIQKEFPEIYRNEEDVYKIFLKAHFRGNLVPVARLVEKTFGEGSFRILGNMETSTASGMLHLETFKKARTRIKSKQL